MKDENESHNKPNGEMDMYQKPRGHNQQIELDQMQNVHNADLGSIEDISRNKYSSIENGEVRDEDEYEDYGAPSEGDLKVKQRSSIDEGSQRNSLPNMLDMNAEVDLCYGQSIAKNVYQTEEANQFHENNPMISTVNLFQISHDTNNYESSVYQTPELNPSLQ